MAEKPIEHDWELAAIACREVAELEDRDSCEHMTPDDMLVTGDELQPIVAAACAVAREAGRQDERERMRVQTIATLPDVGNNLMVVAEGDVVGLRRRGALGATHWFIAPPLPEPPHA